MNKRKYCIKIIHIAFVTLLGLGFAIACGPTSVPCKNGDDCLGTEVCRGRKCIEACKSNSDCLQTETCDLRTGACQAGSSEPTTDGGNPPKLTCGNGQVDTNESCDGANLNGKTCQTEGFFGGSLSCSNCQFDTSFCTQKPPVTCGNGKLDNGENCDGSNLNNQSCQSKGFSNGTLSCNSCRFDTSKCTKEPPQPCGNGTLDSGEECDGSNLNNQTCQTKGFTDGTLGCSSTCQFDTSNCAKKPPQNCNNGKLDSGEECDGSNLNNQTCQTKGFSAGTLKCLSDCRFDTSGCTSTKPPFCGDNKAEGAEKCDGTDLKNKTCQTEGFSSGTLKCNKCALDTSGCQQTAGAKKFGELCSTSKDCATGLLCITRTHDKMGYCSAKCSAALACPTSPKGAKCALKTSRSSICGWQCTAGSNAGCPTGLNCLPLGTSYYCLGGKPAIPAKCGNNKQESTEQCDGTDMAQQTCLSQGFASGTLKCNGQCSFDTSACVGAPKIPNFGKSCSAGSCGTGLVCVNFGSGKSYCTAYCGSTKPCPSGAPPASCNIKLQSGKQVCGWATSSGAPPVCGNGVVDPGEDCDLTATNSTCKGLGYGGGSIKCSSQCKYDFSGCTGSSKCKLPPSSCAQGCRTIVQFSPASGTGYNALHGARLSWSRKDVLTYVKYAAASVHCVYPGTSPLGLGDMSLQNGGTPTDTNGRLRHPAGTHTNGSDMDIAYCQINTPNNNLRAICNHTTNGQDQYHCVAKPHLLDPVKSAFFIAKLLESNSVRVIGVDGKAGPMIAAEMKKLQQNGFISKHILDAFNGGVVTWEETDTKRGWFRFHHHHLHVSFR